MMTTRARTIWLLVPGWTPGNGVTPGGALSGATSPSPAMMSAPIPNCLRVIISVVEMLGRCPCHHVDGDAVEAGRPRHPAVHQRELPALQPAFDRRLHQLRR